MGNQSWGPVPTPTIPDRQTRLVPELVLVAGCLIVDPAVARILLEALELLQRRDLIADPAIIRLAEELAAVADPRPTFVTVEPVWLTITEYAAAANVSGRTARRRAALNPGARKVGNRWRLPATSC